MYFNCLFYQEVLYIFVCQVEAVHMMFINSLVSLVII